MADKILFVDDEQNVLNALQRVFFDSAYQVHFALTGKEALTILEKECMDVLFTDMRMPEMDGYELLSIVRKRWPGVIRGILSGYAEKETVLKAIVNDTAKCYVTKPWDNTALKAQVSHMLAMRNSLRTIGMLETITRIDHLPALPVLYRRVIELIEKEANIGEIARLIEREPGWVAQILKVVNSSFYGMSLTSVRQALTFLGMITVKNIILSSELFESVNGQGAGDWHVDVIWQHSNLCNRLVHGLYETAHRRKIPDEYSLVGILHDVGKLLILKYFSDRMSEIVLEQKTNPGWMRFQIEQKVLGASHAELGAYLLDWWNLPQPLIETCLYHHDPLNEKVLHKDLLALVHIADHLSWKAMRKESYVEIPFEVHEAAGISRMDALDAFEKLDKNLSR